MAKQAKPSGHTSKHAGSGAKKSKHHHSGGGGSGNGSKHAPAHHNATAGHLGHGTAGHSGSSPTVKKHHEHAKPRKLSTTAVECCAAEAVAASARLCGVAVTDDDVLALYWHTAATPTAGASILATLKMAAEFGVAGVRPVSVRPLHLVQDDVPLPLRQRDTDSFGEPDHVLVPGCHETSVILGLDLTLAQADQAVWAPEEAPPWGPHAAVHTTGGLITWGQWIPATPAFLATADEAWEVSWN